MASIQPGEPYDADMPPLESKAERFKRIAQPRVEKVLDGLRLLEQMARGSYEYDDAQIEKMVGTIERRVVQMRQAFDQARLRRRKTKDTFQF